MSYEEFGVSNG